MSASVAPVRPYCIEMQLGLLLAAFLPCDQARCSSTQRLFFRCQNWYNRHMRIVILYRPKTEGEGKAVDYAREYQMRHRDKKIDLISVDTKQGDNLARLYGVVSYPAVMALSGDGQLLQLWQELQLPLMNELDAYLQ